MLDYKSKKRFFGRRWNNWLYDLDPSLFMMQRVFNSRRRNNMIAVMVVLNELPVKADILTGNIPNGPVDGTCSAVLQNSKTAKQCYVKPFFHLPGTGWVVKYNYFIFYS